MAAILRSLCFKTAKIKISRKAHNLHKSKYFKRYPVIRYWNFKYDMYHM